MLQICGRMFGEAGDRAHVDVLRTGYRRIPITATETVSGAYADQRVLCN